jgi:hypothetical protein
MDGFFIFTLLVSSMSAGYLFAVPGLQPEIALAGAIQGVSIIGLIYE